MSLAILIMARAPRPGEVKTRLAPLLGPDGCARLQAELIRHTAKWTAMCTRATWLSFTPADARQEVARLAPSDVSLFAQEGSGLGERMRYAAERVLHAHHGALAVIGTDAPELGPLHLRCAERALAGEHDVCLIPSVDGGYALIALTRPIPHAFELPPAAWGGPDVLDLTLAALQEAGCSSTLLEPVRDLDTPDDARYVAAHPSCPEPIRQALQDPATA